MQKQISSHRDAFVVVAGLATMGLGVASIGQGIFMKITYDFKNAAYQEIYSVSAPPQPDVERSISQKIYGGAMAAAGGIVLTVWGAMCCARPRP